MRIKLAYGKGYQELDIPDRQVAGVVRGKVMFPEINGDQMVARALENPIGTSRLRDIIRSKPERKVAVVVNDITRPTPYHDMLPPLLDEIHSGGATPGDITLVVATGIHRGHTPADNLEIFGREICSKYRIVNHNCDDGLVSLGRLSNGWDLALNREVAQADILVTTGLVGLHYIAGYSGGRKSILPGVAARSLIQASHALMTDEKAALGRYEDNPVHLIMTEAARRAGVDFILNVVTTPGKRISRAVAGDLEAAWLEAVKFCEATQTVEVDAPVDVVIAGCGGYPKDINLYQAQKALDAAAVAVKDGGIFVLVAECREGLGEPVFIDWLERASSPEDVLERFSNEFQLGGHKAYAICRLLERLQVVLVSGMEPGDVRKAFLTPAASLQEAWDYVCKKTGSRSRVLVVPEAPSVAVKLRANI